MSRVRAKPSDESGPACSSVSGVRSGGLAERDGERRGHVGEQVHQQELARVERRRSAQSGTGEREAHLAEVAADEDRDGFANRLPHGAAFDHRVDDGLDPVVGDDDVGGAPGRVGAATAEGDPGVGEADGGRVVGAVAGHRHGAAESLVGGRRCAPSATGSLGRTR